LLHAKDEDAADVEAGAGPDIVVVDGFSDVVAGAVVAVAAAEVG